MNSALDRRKFEKEGCEIAMKIFENRYVESEEEVEGRRITMSNLRNMLEAAREAKKIGSYDYFKLRAAYIARDADYEDTLHYFVRRLLSEINRRGKTDEERIELAIATLTASIYLFSALKRNFRKIIYWRGGRS